MLSDGALLVLALVGLSATISLVLFFAGFFHQSSVRPCDRLRSKASASSSHTYSRLAENPGGGGAG